MQPGYPLLPGPACRHGPPAVRRRTGAAGLDIESFPAKLKGSGVLNGHW